MVFSEIEEEFKAFMQGQKMDDGSISDYPSRINYLLENNFILDNLSEAKILKIQESLIKTIPIRKVYKTKNGISSLISSLRKLREFIDLKNGQVEILKPLKKEKRLLRITWNENNWEVPSVHEWSKANQSINTKAHENQYGFGGEEWLFNPRYNIEGYQYGFIQGLWETQSIDFVDEVYLFSINQATKDRFLIGRIKNVELLDPTDLPKNVIDVYKQFEQDLFQELKNVNADFKKYKISNFYPVLRFQMNDSEIFDEPRLLNELKAGNKYNRFNAYTIDNNLQAILDNLFVSNPFVFNSGKRKNENGSHERKAPTKPAFIKGLHVEIVNELEKYLKPDFSVAKKNISIEKTVFGENIADVVTLNNDKSHSIYEVKTSHNVRYNVRDAIGQLLDYSLWHDSVKISELIIVAPGIINSDHINYLKRLRKVIKINISYLRYNQDTKVKFTEIEI